MPVGRADEYFNRFLFIKSQYNKELFAAFKHAPRFLGRQR